MGQDYGEGLCPDLVYYPAEDEINAVIGCPYLAEVFEEFSERLGHEEAEGNLLNLHATFTIEQFQHNMMRVVPHVDWDDPESGEAKSYEQHFYLHAERSQEE